MPLKLASVKMKDDIEEFGLLLSISQVMQTIP